MLLILVLQTIAGGAIRLYQNGAGSPAIETNDQVEEPGFHICRGRLLVRLKQGYITNQGYEPVSFRAYFKTRLVSSTTSGAEDGRGKVAALLRQHRVGSKGDTKGASINEVFPTLLENGGKVEVWCMNRSVKTPITKVDVGKFCNRACYIVLCTYHLNERKEDYYLSVWIGKDCLQDNQMMATRLTNTLTNSLEGTPAQGCLLQGREPPQFIVLFQPLVILKGGVSSGYKKFVADSLTDDTYTVDGVALIRISGTSLHDSKTVQANANLGGLTKDVQEAKRIKLLQQPSKDMQPEAAEDPADTNPKSNPSTRKSYIPLFIAVAVGVVLAVCIVIYLLCCVKPEPVPELELQPPPTDPVDPAVKDQLPRVTFQSYEETPIAYGLRGCSICLEEGFHAQDELIIIPSCQHVFHRECIKKWMTVAKNCPYVTCSLDLSFSLPHWKIFR